MEPEGGCDAVATTSRGEVERGVGVARLNPFVEPAKEGRCKATWQREFKLPWREAGSLNLRAVQV